MDRLKDAVASTGVVSEIYDELLEYVRCHEREIKALMWNVVSSTISKLTSPDGTYKMSDVPLMNNNEFLGYPMWSGNGAFH